MLLLPKPVAPLLASACLAFLSALGVPLSWRKVHLGSEIVWIGWRFCFKTATAALPSDMVVKILDLLQPLCVAKAKVQRKHVEQAIGILIWYTTGASWLRPWLSAFYKLLYKPRAIPKKLSVQQFEQLRVVLGHDLSVRKPLPALDVDENWKLHSVCGSVVSCLNSQVLQAPRVHQGSVSVVFFSQNHPSTQTCEESAQNSLPRQCLFRHPFRYIGRWKGHSLGPLMPMLQKQMQVLGGGGCLQVARWLHKMPCGFKFHRPGFAAHNPTCSVALLRWKRWRSWF